MVLFQNKLSFNTPEMELASHLKTKMVGGVGGEDR